MEAIAILRSDEHLLGPHSNHIATVMRAKRMILTNYEKSCFLKQDVYFFDFACGVIIDRMIHAIFQLWLIYM